MNRAVALLVLLLVVPFSSGQTLSSSITPINQTNVSSQTFTVTFTDSNGNGLNGTSGIAVAGLLFNYGLDATYGCYLLFAPGYLAVGLQNDSSDGWQGGMFFGADGNPTTGNIPANSQCGISASGAHMTVVNSTTVSFTLPITFQSTFVGTQTVFAAIQDFNNQNTGWQSLGTWSAFPSVNQPPTAVSVSPTGGEGPVPGFAFTLSSPNGYRYMQSDILGLNGVGPGACAVLHYPGPKTGYLLNSAGTDWLWGSPILFGSSASVSSQWCTLSGSASSASGTGNQLVVRPGFTLRSSFAGARTVSGAVQDRNGLNTGLVALGTWTAPGFVPTNLQASATSSRVSLTWYSSTDDAGVTGYKVYRDAAYLGSSPTTSYVDSSVVPQHTYSYRVLAYDAAGSQSAQSSPVSVTTPEGQPPTVPTGLKAVVYSSHVDLSWNQSTDNVAVTGYKVYRNGGYLASSSTTSYVDGTVLSPQTYLYRVLAYDAAGNQSAQSSAVTVTTGSAPPDPAVKEYIRVGGRLLATEVVNVVPSLTTYLVGDSYPNSSMARDANNDGDTFDVGEFGDGLLNNFDLIEALRAVVGLAVPPTCTARFDAIDSSPADTASARGGNGALNNFDLIVTLWRVTLLDTSKPKRLPTGFPLCPENSPLSLLRPLTTGSAAASATPSIDGGTVSAGNPHKGPDGKIRVPITMALNAGLNGESVSFGLQVLANGAPALSGALQFEPDPGMPKPTIVDSGAGPDLICMAWLIMPQTLKGNVKLGELVITLPAKAASGHIYSAKIHGAHSHFAKTAVRLLPGPDAPIAVGKIP